MRIEIIIIIITLLAMGNIYTDGKYLNMAMGWKKYYQMAGIAIVGICLCYMMRNNPERAREIIYSSNEYLRNLPVDKSTSNIINPILDMTKHQNFYNHPQNIRNNDMTNYRYQQRIMKSGTKATKRSVSETKKKFVAAKQNWHCGDCKKQLPAWFEVDHTIRLEHGGSNHVDNLVALCRDCHGKKTAIENL